MKIIIDGESARNALGLLSSITNADHANMEIKGKNVYVSAAGNNKSIRVLVKGDIEDSGDGFGFNVYMLQNILKGRKTITLELKKSQVFFVSKTDKSTLTGDFAVLPFETIDIVDDEETNDLKIAGTTMTALQDAVKRVRITDVFTPSNVLTLFVGIGKDGLHAVVYDDYHAAFCHNSAVTERKAAEFAIGMTVWDQIAGVAAGQDYSLHIGNHFVTARSLGFEMSIPSLQPNEGQSLAAAKGAVKGLYDTWERGKTTLSIPIGDLMETMESLSGVSDGKSGIVFEERDGKIQMRLESTFGNAREQRGIKLRGWDGKSFTLTPKLFLDVMGVFPANEAKIVFTKEYVVIVDEPAKGKTLSVYSCVTL